MNFDDMMKKMRIKYLEDLSAKTDDLKSLAEQKDIKGLESFFHKLKGSGASYGLPQISEFGAKYESKAKENSITEAELSGLADEFSELLEHCQEEKQAA